MDKRRKMVNSIKMLHMHARERERGGGRKRVSKKERY